MIYLNREREEFKKTMEEFAVHYETLLEGMYKTFKAKGVTRDVNSPIHHRMSPTTMVALAQAKLRRIEAVLTVPEWEVDSALRDKVIEEGSDVANYCLFLAAVCLMLGKEAQECS